MFPAKLAQNISKTRSIEMGSKTLQITKYSTRTKQEGIYQDRMKEASDVDIRYIPLPPGVNDVKDERQKEERRRNDATVQTASKLSTDRTNR